MRTRTRSLARRGKRLLMDNATRMAPFVGGAPGLGSFLFQGEHPLIVLLGHHGISEVLDVGANEGQFAATLRLLGYQGRIVSFEPVSATFARLQKRAASDRRWEVVQTAVGETNGETEIHISENTCLSSTLEELSKQFADRDPDAAVAYSEQVPIATLDQLAAQRSVGRRAFLKIDTQGSERAVLDGAGEILATCAGVQLELSLAAPFYDGEATAGELTARLEADGLTRLVLNPLTHTLRWGDLVQADAIFWRLRDERRVRSSVARRHLLLSGAEIHPSGCLQRASRHARNRQARSRRTRLTGEQNDAPSRHVPDISWRDPHTPVPKEIIPQLAFDRLFRTNKAPVTSSIDPNDPSLLASLQRDETSVLDLVESKRSPCGSRAARRISSGSMSISSRFVLSNSVWRRRFVLRSGGSTKASSHSSGPVRVFRPAARSTCA